MSYFQLPFNQNNIPLKSTYKSDPSSKGLSINDLPNELITNILERTEFLNHLSVCKDWNDIIQQNILSSSLQKIRKMFR